MDNYPAAYFFPASRMVFHVERSKISPMVSDASLSLRISSNYLVFANGFPALPTAKQIV